MDKFELKIIDGKHGCKETMLFVNGEKKYFTLDVSYIHQSSTWYAAMVIKHKGKSWPAVEYLSEIEIDYPLLRKMVALIERSVNCG